VPNRFTFGQSSLSPAARSSGDVNLSAQCISFPLTTGYGSTHLALLDDLRQADDLNVAAPSDSCEHKLSQMMQVTRSGRRMYVPNSSQSTLDRSGRSLVRLVNVGQDGLKVDSFFNVDLNYFYSTPDRGHDIVVNREISPR
jgi:hypothetical protein